MAVQFAKFDAAVVNAAFSSVAAKGAGNRAGAIDELDAGMKLTNGQLVVGLPITYKTAGKPTSGILDIGGLGAKPRQILAVARKRYRAVLGEAVDASDWRPPNWGYVDSDGVRWYRFDTPSVPAPARGVAARNRTPKPSAPATAS